MEIEIKYMPRLVKNKQYYQFTAIDCSSRWRYLKICDNHSNFSSVRFLSALIEIAHLRFMPLKLIMAVTLPIDILVT